MYLFLCNANSTRINPLPKPRQVDPFPFPCGLFKLFIGEHMDLDHFYKIWQEEYFFLKTEDEDMLPLMRFIRDYKIKRDLS